MDEFNAANDPETRQALFEPLVQTLAERCRSARRCPGLSDLDFALSGCMRVLLGAASGREHVQNSLERGDAELSVSSFFKALRSKRRADMIQECSQELYRLAAAKLSEADLLEGFPELGSLGVVAVDGHQIGEASHSAREGKASTVNTLYELDLRNGLARPLVVASSHQGRSHEMKAFRDSRGRPGRGRLEVVDRAYVDLKWWDAQASAGALMLTRSKSNMSPYFRRELQWDRSAPINQGVASDREAGFSCGRSLRWIEFADPEGGEGYSFITTCWSLPPGLLCMLYLMRWRIEKLYDSFKNKLAQAKAWATTEHARSMQANFICMAHNLMVLFVSELEYSHGIREEKVLEKRRKWLDLREARAKKQGRSLHVFHRSIRSSSQITLQFLRSLRNAILMKMPLELAIPVFRRSMQEYLS